MPSLDDYRRRAEEILGHSEAVAEYYGDGAEDGATVVADESNHVVANSSLSFDDFAAYLPAKRYIFVPTGDTWPASGVDACLPRRNTGKKKVSASAWLDRNSPVHQMIWAPGLPQFIDGKVLDSGGWIDKPGVRAFNLYKPPKAHDGRADGAQLWIDHIHAIYPDEAEHLIRWLAHRVQRPHDKINHAIVLGGDQGIGKDTLLEAVKWAVGAWNFKDISPVQLIGRFNGFVKSVVLRINEGRDMGDLNRYAFYEHMKVYAAAPPDVIRCDEKNIREHDVLNCCGVIITTNHKTNGLYLPEDDRRHFVCWSDRKRDEFPPEYWNTFYSWYERGGLEDVAAYLAGVDLSKFNAKAPPPRTEAWWAIVNAERSTEAGELSDVLEELESAACGQCRAYSLGDIIAKAESRLFDGLAGFLSDRKNRRVILAQMEKAGYGAVRNENAKDGLWKVSGARQALYAKNAFTRRDQLRAAQTRCSVSVVSEVSENPSCQSQFSPRQSRDTTRLSENIGLDSGFEQDGKSLTSPTTLTNGRTAPRTEEGTL